MTLYKIKFLTALFLLSFCGICRADEGYATAIKVETILKTSTDVAGKPIEYPKTGKPEVSGVMVEIPVGQSTGWHFHPNPCVAYLIQGQITVEDAMGTKRQFKAGDSFAELVNVNHCGYNTGDQPVKIVMFVIGEVGIPISQKQ